jgi:Raf kinase inhibitor-like YbhB/YbcL family protein
MQLTSPAFTGGGAIPVRYTCDGDNISPEVHWAELPDDTVSLALICEDPDAPGGIFTHWLIWGLDPAKDGIGGGEVPAGSVQGRNDFGQIGYGGPCPPHGHGPHHYHFLVFALLKGVELGPGARRAEVLSAVKETTLAGADLVGTYER